jgi:hypothetical protein
MVPRRVLRLEHHDAAVIAEEMAGSGACHAGAEHQKVDGQNDVS